MYSTDFVVMPYKNVTFHLNSSPWRCRVDRSSPQNTKCWSVTIKSLYNFNNLKNYIKKAREINISKIDFSRF